MGLKLAYIGLTLFTVLFLLIIGFRAINESSSNPKKDKMKLVLGIIIWQLFILTLSSSDFLKSHDFPPRFAIAFIIPSFIFTGVFLFRNRNKSWIKYSGALDNLFSVISDVGRNAFRVLRGEGNFELSRNHRRVQF